ncbi:hypothetical protein [Treponema maltophilum]|uniref:hypothetical protein n=1 Tax=Treponema maltophilum TaxID=51160 RepID=UPI003D8E411C
MQKLGKHPLSTESGATGMGKWAQAFGGTGLLEMNIGRNGISMQLGMGGIDVGGALYDLGKRSYDKSMLQRYEREHGKDKGEAAYSAYVYGDWTQEHTAARLASGKDELYFSGGKEYTAKTSSNGKGGRRIEITDSKDRRLNAIQLGHEAYRDGIVGGNNAQETIAAVLGHTGMGVRMEADGKRVEANDLLRAEMDAYKRGDMDALLMNALTNYDSTDDYWKLISRADGTHSFEAEYDKDGNLIREVTIEYQDTDGNVLGTAKPEGQEFQRGLGQAASLANAFGKERVMQMLGMKDINDLSHYDNKTLKDVLKLDDRSLMLLRRSGGVNLESFNVGEKEILSLLGEKLLKRIGGKWDGKNWVGLEKLSEYASLTDRKVLEGGIVAKVNEDGSFTYGTIEERIGRDTRSYYIYNAEKNEKRSEYGGLDSRTIISRDLKGNIIDKQTKTFDGWTTVQSMLPGEDSKGKIPYTAKAFIPMNVRDLYGGKRTIKVGPETIAEGAVAYKIVKSHNDNLKTQYIYEGDIYLQAVMGNLLAKGYRIGADGNAGYAEGRHLGHPTKNYGNTGCGVTGGDNNMTNFYSYTNFLTKTLGLPVGTVLFGKIYQKDNPYEWVYR